VEPRVAQGAVMSAYARGPFYRLAWRAEALEGRQLAVEFYSASFEE
jgi:hypothetical protein